MPIALKWILIGTLEFLLMPVALVLLPIILIFRVVFESYVKFRNAEIRRLREAKRDTGPQV